MTPLGWTALAVTTGIALAALALALACARRLRELTDRLAAAPAAGHDPYLPTVGAPVPAFFAPTTAGGIIVADDLAGPDTLVLFVTADCESCLELIDRVTAAPGRLAGFHRVVAVLIGPAEQRAAQSGRLAAVADVVEDDEPAGLAARFGVRSFPTVVLAGGGVIRAAANELDDIPRPAPA
jgi:hypothetical protein